MDVTVIDDRSSDSTQNVGCFLLIDGYDSRWWWKYLHSPKRRDVYCVSTRLIALEASLYFHR